MSNKHNLFGKKYYVGNPVKIGKSAKRYKNFLMEDGEVVMEYKGIRNAAVFTNKRLMVIDPQGLTGRKVEVISIPWKTITGFSLENSGTFDLDAELKVCGSGIGICELEFLKGADITKLSKFLNNKIL